MNMRTRGFTLIEIIATLLVVAILAGTILFFIQGPVKGFVEQSRRQQVVAAASAALDRMVEDVRGALPNSVRVASGGRDLQIIPIVDAGRYRAGPSSNYPTPDERLQFNKADGQWNIESPLAQITLPYSSTSDRLVIYNTGQPGADAYANADVITPAAATIAIAAVNAAQAYAESHVTLGSGGFRFAYRSPQQRVYLVHESVSWLCNPDGTTPANGTLHRYVSPIQASQPTNPALGDPALTGVAACSFQYQPGTATRAGLVTLELTLTQGKNSVHLVRQVHIDNVP